MRKLQRLSMALLASSTIIPSIISTPIHANEEEPFSLVEIQVEQLKGTSSFEPASYLDEHLNKLSDIDKQIEKAKEEARLKKEAEARKKAEKESRKKAEEEARRKAEEEARRIKEQTRSYTWNGSVLTPAAGVNYGPSGKETYYNLPMQGVISIMRGIGNTDEYWVRNDGVKMLGNYIMVAADLSIRPRGSLVETSLGTGIVCDTGSFIYSNPTQLDIAVAW